MGTTTRHPCLNVPAGRYKVPARARPAPTGGPQPSGKTFLVTFTQKPLGINVRRRTSRKGAYVTKVKSDVAKQHGVREGQDILAIGNTEVTDMDCDEIVKLIKSQVLPFDITFQEQGGAQPSSRPGFSSPGPAPQAKPTGGFQAGGRPSSGGDDWAYRPGAGPSGGAKPADKIWKMMVDPKSGISYRNSSNMADKNATVAPQGRVVEGPVREVNGTHWLRDSKNGLFLPGYVTVDGKLVNLLKMVAG